MICGKIDRVWKFNLWTRLMLKFRLTYLINNLEMRFMQTTTALRLLLIRHLSQLKTQHMIMNYEN